MNRCNFEMKRTTFQYHVEFVKIHINSNIINIPPSQMDEKHCDRDYKLTVLFVFSEKCYISQIFYIAFFF